MKQSQLIFQLFLFLVYYSHQVKCDEVKFTPDFCNGKEAGIYPDISSNCKAFFMCEGSHGVSVHVPCIFDMKFDKVTCTCQSGEKVVSCPVGSDQTPCHTVASVAHQTTHARQPRKISTSSKNPISGDVKSAIPSSKATFCEQREDGWYADVQAGCKKYFVCNRNSDLPNAVLFCPELHVFDQSSCSCTKNNVSCGDKGPLKPCRPDKPAPLPLQTSLLKPTLAPATLQPSTPKLSLAPEASWTSTPKAKWTPAALRASQVSKLISVTSTTTSAAVKTGSDFACGNKATGLYPHVHDSCHSYHACIKGLPHTYNYVCPSNFQFDSEYCRCLPSDLVSECTPALADNPCLPKALPVTTTTTSQPTTPISVFCRGKGPGYYADINRGCEWFFVCLGGGSHTSQIQCPAHLRFDHFSCTCQYSYYVACNIFDEIPCIPPHFWGNETSPQA